MFRIVAKCKLLDSPLTKLYSNRRTLLPELPDNNFTETFLPTGLNLDFSYLCSPENTADIKRSIQNRKATGNIDKVIKLYNELQCSSHENHCHVEQELIREALKIPNKSHPSLKDIKDVPKVIKNIISPRGWEFKPLTFEMLVKQLNLIKTENLTNLTGPRSYFLIDGLAALEEALIQYTLQHLLEHKFQMISVPDILPRSTIEFCGMETRGERTQVYQLDDIHGTDTCLSGTAEMGIAHFLQRKEFKKSELPLKLAAVSRCFRAETSKISVEKGIYRVHQFTKVEMFGVTSCKDSDNLLEQFLNIQETLFTALGLQVRILDMPECELGAQAYRKFDIEGYMPGKEYWGELSSASNCIDYQSRRLNIKCDDGNFAHTINGTACAVPRLLIAILETNQNEDGTVFIPNVLVPYLGYKTLSNSRMPKLIPFKIK